MSLFSRTSQGLLLSALLMLCPLSWAAPVTPGAMAPDFTLRTATGPNVRLAEQRGKVVMLNFWATWCGPCRQEIPHLNKLHDKYRPAGLALWGVNVDDEPQRAIQLATQLGMGFALPLDADKQVSRLYDLKAMPSTVLIDRDGRVRFVHRGYREGFEDLYDQQIRSLLKE
jgi:peroxiredoxin